MPILGIVASSQQSAFIVQNSYESIATVNVSSAVSSVSFTSIPSTYSHLQIRCLTRLSGTGSDQTAFWIQLNSDTGNNYTYHGLRGDGATASSYGAAGQSATVLGYQPEGGYTSGIFAPYVIDILEYTNSNKFKTVRSLGGYDTNNTGTEKGVIGTFSGLWQSGSTITSITLFGSSPRNIVQYSSFALYGIKGA